MEDWPKVYIIVLNWNGWQDTVECLESLRRLSHPNYQIVVIDNGSTDGSVDKIKAWAKNSSLVLLETGKNLGYAGGNNVGLRYALSRGDFGYAWVLNNDTVVHPDALTHMVVRMREKPEAGICGASILQYYYPDKIDTIGGSKYDRWFAQAFGLESGKKFDFGHPEKYQKLERKMDYVAGSSTLVSRQFLLDIGLLCEDYFLFFEEIDWATRARGRYQLTLAPKSIIYHKGGASVGKNSKASRFSTVFDFYNTKNRLAFSSKFYPYVLPFLYLSILGYIIDRLRIGAFENARVIARAAFNRF